MPGKTTEQGFHNNHLERAQAHMGQAYRLSSESVSQLVNVERTARIIGLVFYTFLLLLHFFLSIILFLIGYFIPVLFFSTGICLLAILAIWFFRSPAFYQQYYSSYQIELSEESISFTRKSKRRVTIPRNEVTQIKEVIPEGEMYVQGHHKVKLIDVYTMLVKEHPEIKEILASWKQPEKSALSIPKLLGPIIAVASGFFGLYCILRGFNEPYQIVIGMMFLGITITGWYKVQYWPVVDRRIKLLLWAAMIPTVLGTLVLLVDLLQLVSVALTM